MIAQRMAQGRMQQVGRGMIAARMGAAAIVHFLEHHIVERKGAGCDFTHVNMQIAGGFARVGDDKFRAVIPTNNAGVPALTAGFSVERGLVGGDFRFRAGIDLIDQGAIRTERHDLAFRFRGGVTQEFRGPMFAAHIEPISFIGRFTGPGQAARASARWRSMAALKPSVSTPMPRLRNASSVRSSGKP